LRSERLPWYESDSSAGVAGCQTKCNLLVMLPNGVRDKGRKKDDNSRDAGTEWGHEYGSHVIPPGDFVLSFHTLPLRRHILNAKKQAKSFCGKLLFGSINIIPRKRELDRMTPSGD